MRFLRGKSSLRAAETEQHAAVEVSGTSPFPDTPTESGRGHSSGKGRPTPSRREAEGRKRGPAPPPPRTQREALRRMRASSKERREAGKVRRERMMAGDERYLLPRDRGADKAYARDLIDARRNVMGLFMPLALAVLLVLFLPVPAVQQFVSLLTTAMLLTMVVEGYLLGRLVNKRVRAKFPGTRSSRLGLGFYAFTRATQLRRLRVPKPRVKPGDPV
ncbi:MAG: DUF3043 domain-containing protein [Pseudonocardiaceae bacterium]